MVNAILLADLIASIIPNFMDSVISTGCGCTDPAVSSLMTVKIHRKSKTFRIDPVTKAAAVILAHEGKQTLSEYIEQLIKLDLWRKKLSG
jgi:hypothetical protein